MVFRSSQLKFSTNEETINKMEVVKFSSPVAVSLNKPLINILDQVSRLQSHSSHKRISNRIFELMEKNISELCENLLYEQKARDKMADFPRLIRYSNLKSINFSDESFFRLILRASAKVSLHKVRHKHNIMIPADLGRVMFGVVDSTGILQYGQVFVKYSKNLYSSNKRSPDQVLKGKVMITKNPCTVGGDVRIFEAVDVPALSHLRDVVVFPRHGTRPHADEMAGSDLDGDEYVVIWDPKLCLERNEPAFDYTPEKVLNKTLTKKHCTKKCVNLWLNMLKMTQLES